MTGNRDRDDPGKAASFKDQSECPYFTDGRTSTIEFIIPGEIESRNFHKFLARGYRRVGRAYYHNVCNNCSSCLPIRIEIDKFTFSRSHNRTLKKNEDIHIEILTRPEITPEKLFLYDKYVKSKHGEDKNEKIESEINVLLNMHYGYARTIEMDYYFDSKLIGVGIVDEGEDALSSNYFYYDTDYLGRRPGIFSILKEIELAKSLGKKYYYLGFYIEENPKMSYKKFFRPNQVYERGQWREFLKRDNMSFRRHK